MKKYPEIKLEIDDDSSFTQVKFIKTNMNKIDDAVNGAVNGVVNGVVNGAVKNGINELYNFIKNNPNQKANNISKELNIPLRTIQRWLKELKDDNKIEFKGSPKTGGYFVKENE